MTVPVSQVDRKFASYPLYPLALMNLEEKTIERVNVFDGILLKVYRDRIRLSDQSEGVREWIRHLGASAVVPLFEDGSTLLVRQWRYASGRPFLEVPAGKLDLEGESPDSVARRELEEETGWCAGRLHHLQSLYPAIGYSDEIIHFFLAEGLMPGKIATHADEHLEVVRLPFSEALEMALRGELPDMKTAIALRLAADHLSEKKGNRPI